MANWCQFIFARMEVLEVNQSKSTKAQCLKRRVMLSKRSRNFYRELGTSLTQRSRTRIAKEKKKEKWRRYDDFHEDVSDDFESLWTDSGTSDFECACGRTHIATENDYWREDEQTEAHLQSLCESAEEDPEQYVLHFDSHVSITRISGEEFVVGCECNRVARYEVFIRENAHKILEFLRRDAERELERAMKAAEAAWMADEARKRLERTKHL